MKLELDPIASTSTPAVEKAWPAGPEPPKHIQGRWLNVVSHLDPRYGGLSAAVPQLGSAIAESSSLSIGVAAFCAPDESHLEHPKVELSYWPLSRFEWMRHRSLRARFRHQVERVDGLHIHGLWEQSTALAARTARDLRKPYVLSAHGMLEPWALANRRMKKRIYAALVERRNIDGAACLHALTHAEAEDYRRFGYRGPIAVIPNGVHIPQSLSADLFFEQFPGLRHQRLLLFLGRLHPKKGLDILIESWSALAGQWPDAHLVLAGPDCEGTRALLDRKIQELGLTADITFTGMLSGELKWSALAASECFLLPSYSEGLSISVLEAMGAGIPVIISEQCNLPEVEHAHAGWVIQSNPRSLTYAMREVLTHSPSANLQMGRKGRALIEERYTWPSVAARMAELYRWLQGGSIPKSFELRVD